MISIPLIALTLFSTQSTGWPHFLGPDRNGVASDSDWNAKGAAEPLWSLNVGAGYSCPSIVGDRLVTMGYDAEAKLDHILCLARETGEELWRFSYEAVDKPQFHGGGTLTTPCIADDIVYTLNRHGRAFALDLETGEVLWDRGYRDELELKRTFHGYSASPIVMEDTILFVFGGTAAVADRDNGEIIWQTEDHGGSAFTNATVFELRGRMCAAIMLHQTFFVLDLDDGEVLHEIPWELQGNAVHVAQPLVIGNRVLLSTAYGKGSSMLQLGEESEPKVLWTNRKLRNKVTGLYMYQDYIYGFDESMLTCFDLEGNEKWRTRGLGMGALSIVGGRLLVLSADGELVIAEATAKEFRELSRAEVLEGGDYWTMPVVVDGLIYVRNSLGDMKCLDHRSAEKDG